jgi:hypothetical protein
MLSGLSVLLFIVSALVIFSALSVQFGADSRIDSSDSRRSW